ncbi:MAG TPA: DsrE/DsrF/DrsH-like family protein [Thermoleophilia bacterium]|nr:DsrE/DsrF/DrsH-like family protein [Thermoleophilia bacterium]
MTVLTKERTLEERIEALETALHSTGLDSAATDPLAANRVCMVVFSGDLDKVLAALTMATGAAAMGTDVCLFFTFWATPVLRRAHSGHVDRPVIDRVLGRMLPRGTKGLKLSRMNMGGLGTAMIKRRMREKQFASCDELLEMARESGVRIRVCDMSMDLLGIRMDELIDYPGLEQCGVATFMEAALDSCVTLFV